MDVIKNRHCMNSEEIRCNRCKCLKNPESFWNDKLQKNFKQCAKCRQYQQKRYIPIKIRLAAEHDLIL